MMLGVHFFAGSFFLIFFLLYLPSNRNLEFGYSTILQLLGVKFQNLHMDFNTGGPTLVLQEEELMEQSMTMKK